MMDSYEVIVKKISPRATIPKVATSGSVGFDLCASESSILRSRDQAVINTGLAFELPESLFGSIGM